MRKIIITGLIILLLVIAGYVVWRWFLPQKESATPISTQPVQNFPSTDTLGSVPATAAPTPISAHNKISFVVSDQLVRQYWIAGETIYILSPEGILYGDTNGATQEVQKFKLQDIAAITPSPDGLRLITKSSPGLENFNIFDISKKTWAPLPEDIEAIAWSPDGKEIAFLKRGVNGRELGIYTLATKKSRILRSVNVVDVLLDWPSTNTLYLESKPARAISGIVLKYDLKTNMLTPIFTTQPGLSVRWSHTGMYALLFSNSTIADSTQFQIVDADGHIKAEPFLRTLPQKCAFGGDATLYCAIPKDQKMVSKFPDSYHQLLPTNDDLAKISFSNPDGFEMGPLTEEGFEQKIDADKLQLSNNTLYFINRYDQKLYSLDISE